MYELLSLGAIEHGFYWSEHENSYLCCVSRCHSAMNEPLTFMLRKPQVTVCAEHQDRDLRRGVWGGVHPPLGAADRCDEVPGRPTRRGGSRLCPGLQSENLIPLHPVRCSIEQVLGLPSLKKLFSSALLGRLCS